MNQTKIVIGMFSIGNLTFEELINDPSLYGNVSDVFSRGDLYLESEYFTPINFTELEDFEEFDGRDLMNVIAYALMSAGKVVVN